MKELQDGRVVLVDEAEKTVLLLNSQLATASTLGGRGSGPGEYLVPSRLFSLAGDSSAVLDDPNRRLLVFTPEGEPGGVFNFFPEFRAARASDGHGRLYQARRDGDSFAIVRWTPPSPTFDTVGHFPVPADARPEGMAIPLVDVNPFPMSATWAVAADGTIAIVHPDPYRVEVIRLDGAREEGPVMEVRRVEVSEDHKNQWRESFGRPQVEARVTLRGGGGAATNRIPAIEPANWPRYLPPFLREAATFAGDGRLWVQRTTPAGDPPTFDVFDSQGRRVEQMVLPQGRRLLGFGLGTLYAVSRDDLDLEYLEQYWVGR
ncbi:MAG: hypothetical protein PVJ76_19830 [Gemmatimonadota bacterium]